MRSYFNGSNVAHIVINEQSYIGNNFILESMIGLNYMYIHTYFSTLFSVGLAVDWISDKLYWIGINIDEILSEFNTLSVNVLDLSTNNHTELIISLNTFYGYYYWLYFDGHLPMVIDPFMRLVKVYTSVERLIGRKRE